jgi:hypothetical protein
MKKINSRYIASALLTGFVLVWASGCKKDTANLDLATNYPTTPEVFTDAFSRDLKFDAWGKVTNFFIDNAVKYKGTASMKIEVPDASDPAGNFAGGVFYTSMARDLSGYDAVTFWAKASQAATMNASFGGYPDSPSTFSEKYKVALDVKLNSNWQKFIIPIPDPSVLTSEKGMFSYAAGALADGSGYTIWIDEVKFEKLGTLAHQKLSISNIASWPSSSGFIGQTYTTNVVETVNLPNGVNVQVAVPTSYLTFTSSDNNVATVNADGIVTLQGTGSATIAVKLGDLTTSGTITLSKAVPMAPTPTVAAANVISLFSDAYPGIPIDTPKWDYVTNVLNIISINGNNIMSFSTFSYLPITFNSTNASAMTHLHMDIFVVAPSITNQPVRLVLKDNAAGEKGFNYLAGLTTGSWKSLDIPLSSFGLVAKSSLIFLIIAADPQSPKMTDLYLDNVYFYHN